MAYSKTIKTSILKQILGESKRKVKEVSESSGISVYTIYKWLKEAKSSTSFIDTAEKSPRQYTSKEKYHLLMQAAKTNEKDRGFFLREHGIHSQHLTLWDQELRSMAANKDTENKKKLSRLEKENRDLKKELARKEKALAEAAALLVLKKKLDAIIEDHEAD